MTQLLCQTDSYLKEFDAVITKSENNTVCLNQTAFYFQSGGQPWDTGTLTSNNKTARVISVKKSEPGIAHELDQNPFTVGDKVHGTLDWERRYKLMRSHTAAHLLSSIIYKLTGTLVTGKNLDLDKSHIDFGLDNFDRDQLERCVKDANAAIQSGAEVTCYTMQRDEAFKIPQINRLAGKMPPNLPELRIVEIKNLDIQTCGGTHIKDIREIGSIEVIKCDNKGQGKKRLYYRVVP